MAKRILEISSPLDSQRQAKFRRLTSLQRTELGTFQLSFGNSRRIPVYFVCRILNPICHRVMWWHCYVVQIFGLHNGERCDQSGPHSGIHAAGACCHVARWSTSRLRRRATGQALYTGETREHHWWVIIREKLMINKVLGRHIGPLRGSAFGGSRRPMV